MMKRTLLLSVVCLLAALPLAAAKRAFTIEDFYRVQSISDLSVTPDGHSMVYVVSTTDLPRAKRVSQIWISDSDGTNARQLTFDEKGASSPIVAPDGSAVAFVSSRGGSPNLYLLPLNHGGEARKLTDSPAGVADPVWSPDGKRIAFSSDVYPECGGDDACNKRIADRWSDGPLKAHMADSLLYRHWTAWKDGTRTHTFVIDVASGNARDVTPGDFDWPSFQLGGGVQYDFSPDGRELAVVSNHDRTPESSTNNDLWLVALDQPSAAPRDITASNPAFDGTPKYSPDGRYLAYRMQKQPGYESDLFRLALYDRASGQSRVLTESFRNWIDDFAWSRDSKSIYFTGPVEGENPIFRLELASGKITQILRDKTIDDFEVTRGNRLVYIRRAIGSPSEIFSATIGASASPVQLTHVNQKLVDEVDIRPAETMWIEGAGGTKVETFLVKPHDFDPNKKYPLILNVHGGPQSQWADSFRGDWQVYPGAGYIVAFPNPHGSTGYGQDYTAEISGDWGGMVYEDVMKVTDALEKLPYVDANRIGTMGWSYGGYMMMWLEGHTTRFKAIASMMGVYDLRAMHSATEELWFPEWDLRGLPWTSDLYQKWSPSNFVTNFKTPCLVISGERDYRVPYTQSLEFFTDLQKMNVPSRLLIYSDAGHWPSWYEMALYYTAHLEWFQKYLGGGGPPWTSEAFLRNAVFDVKTGERVKEELRGSAASKQETKQETNPPENTQGKPDQKPKG